MFIRALTIAMIVVFAVCAVHAQVQVLDVDSFDGAFNYGSFTPDGSEYVYRVDDGVNDATLFALSPASGVSRQLPTDGIDAGLGLRPLRTAEGRILVFDGPLAESTAYAVDFVGQAPPIPLSPEPGERAVGILAPTGDQVVLLISGDPFSNNAAQRDRLYTRSILGGPATEILGGLPQFREVDTAVFSGDGGTVLVRTSLAFGGPTPERLYLATSGLTGLTPVLESPASNVTYDVLGSDAAGDYFVVNRDFSGTFSSGLLWSVPVEDPGTPRRLDARADGTDIGYRNEVLDAAGDRVLYTSEEPEFNPRGEPQVASLMEVPIDGSSLPAVLGNLPAGVEPSVIMPFAGAPWDYVSSTDAPFQDGPMYAVNRDTGAVIELAGAEGFHRFDFDFRNDGSSVIFTDNRTSGNDLYLGRPSEAAPVQTLLDVAEEDWLVHMVLTPNEDFAVVALIATSAGSDGTVADRLLAVPLDGGSPIPLADVSGFPVRTGIVVFGGVGPWVSGEKVMYVTGDTSGQIGIYTVDLPGISLPGDYNGNGLVEQADLDLVLGNWGASADDLPAAWVNDPAVGFVDQAELDGVLSYWGSSLTGSAAAIPEPEGWMLAGIASTFAGIFVCRRSPAPRGSRGR